MDVLTNKRYIQFDYTSRKIGVPVYYNSNDDREMYGIGANMLKDCPWSAHKVSGSDSLHSLALKYYNNPTLWWAIAYMNDIFDPFVHLQTKYSVIKIPTITSIRFGDER